MRFIFKGTALLALALPCVFKYVAGEAEESSTVADAFQLSEAWINGIFDLLRGHTQHQFQVRQPVGNATWSEESLLGMLDELDTDLKTLFGNQLGSQIHNAWVQDYYHPPSHPDEIHVDDYVRELLEIEADPDCTTAQGELDVQSPDFSVERAAQIWHKCRMIILRNVFSQDTIQEFRRNATQFVYDIKDGKVNDKGTTTFKEAYFVHEVESLRWDMLLPPSYAKNADLMANPTIMEFLSDERVLGEDVSCVAYGMMMAEPTAKGQMWHTDTPGLFHDYRSLENHEFAGHRVPSAVITMLAPLLDMTAELGPTQFCVGAHALNGLDVKTGLKDIKDGGWLAFKDRLLKEDLIDLVNLEDEEFYSKFITDVCPLGMWRSPLLSLGDLAFWDYSTVHRSGPNESKEKFRSVAYVSYARNGVKDSAFDGYRRGDLTFNETSGITGRFAKPAFGWDNSRGDNDKPVLEYLDSNNEMQEEEDDDLYLDDYVDEENSYSHHRSDGVCNDATLGTDGHVCSKQDRPLSGIANFLQNSTQKV